MKLSIRSSLFLFFTLTALLSGCVSASTSIPPTLTQEFTSTPESPSTPRPTRKPKPTSTPFVLPSGDFAMSWDIYNSEYDSLGGILTIRRQSSNYTMRLVMPDGSNATYDLTVVSKKGDEIRLTERPGNPFGDYMYISPDNGYLFFCDDQGVIYSVPPLK